MPPIRAALCARYSSREQDGTSTIESQLRECRSYARRHGLTVVEDAIYIDRAREGGYAERRDAFKAMIAAAQRTPRPFEKILVWKFSRFARNREESAIYKGLLRRRGIEVISVSEPVDHHSATGILTEGLIEVIDQFYSVRLAEDVRRGQIQTALEGFSTGGQAPYGYRRHEVPDPHGRTDRTGRGILRVTLVIEPAEAVIVRRIFVAYDGGAGYKRIVVGLNQDGLPGPGGGSWDVSAVRELLRNPVYRGARVYGRHQKVRTETGSRSKRGQAPATWTVKEGTHPAIIDLTLWERVQRRLARVAALFEASGRHMSQIRGLHSAYLLTGILTCGVCGAHFTGRPGAKRKAGDRPYYYGCSFHVSRGAGVCRNRTLLPRETLERDLLDVLLQTVLTPATLDQVLAVLNRRLRAQAAQTRPRLRELQQALTQTEREITNYTRAVARGHFASLEQALQAAEARRATLQHELAQRPGAEPGAVQLTRPALLQRLTGLTETLRGADPARLRDAIETAVARIVVADDGGLALDVKPAGLLGDQGAMTQLPVRKMARKNNQETIVSTLQLVG